MQQKNLYVTNYRKNYDNSIFRRVAQVEVEDPRVTLIKTRLVSILVIVMAIVVVVFAPQIVDGLVTIFRGGVGPITFVTDSLNAAHNWEVFKGVLH